MRGLARGAKGLLLSQGTDRLGAQAFRYLIVGGVATIVDFGVLVLLVDVIGFHYLLANVCSFTAGLVTNYLLSIRWVFATRLMSSAYLEFLLFGTIGVVGLGLSELIMYVGVNGLEVHYSLAKAAAVAGVLAWNFGARRALLFRPGTGRKGLPRTPEGS
jgi:putative flippase GtrA